MSQKHVLSATAADIQRDIEASCEESEPGHENLQMAVPVKDTCTEIPTRKSNCTRSRSSYSSSKAKKETMDTRMDSFEKKMEEQLGSIIKIVQIEQISK